VRPNYVSGLPNDVFVQTLASFYQVRLEPVNNNIKDVIFLSKFLVEQNPDKCHFY
jgi:hypothetical protein